MLEVNMLSKEEMEKIRKLRENAAAEEAKANEPAPKPKNLIVAGIVFLIVLALIIFAIYKIFFK